MDFPLRDAVFPGNRRPNEGREDMPPPVEDIAAQAQPQDFQYVNMGYYDIANGYPPPQGHRDHIIGDNAGIVQDVPAQVHIAPPAPDIDAFIDEAQQAAAGPAPAFLHEMPHQVPVPNGRATEALRELATLYLHDPNLQVAGIRMEPGQADGVTVVIILLNEMPHQVPVPNGRAIEVLRQLATLYLHDPNSQVAGIRMEPGQADGVMVVITLRLTDL